ncbi:MAG: hypothetical protein M1815_003946 [Lichina confinis]|nr:MAG: hypothetical protein M1815_003946 [Lichina confinis]
MERTRPGIRFWGILRTTAAADGGPRRGLSNRRSEREKPPWPPAEVDRTARPHRKEGGTGSAQVEGDETSKGPASEEEEEQCGWRSRRSVSSQGHTTQGCTVRRLESSMLPASQPGREAGGARKAGATTTVRLDATDPSRDGSEPRRIRAAAGSWPLAVDRPLLVRLTTWVTAAAAAAASCLGEMDS